MLKQNNFLQGSEEQPRTHIYYYALRPMLIHMFMFKYTCTCIEEMYVYTCQGRAQHVASFRRTAFFHG